jgi:hypothetical protein
VDTPVMFGFEWGFLDEISWWTLGIGVALAAGGAYLLRDLAFAIGCLVAVCVDVAIVMSASRRARNELEAGRIDAVAPIVMLAGRLVVKTGLLALALVLPRVLSFTGTVAGALTFDITLALVGSVIALSRGMRASRSGR